MSSAALKRVLNTIVALSNKENNNNNIIPTAISKKMTLESL
jgi:hypothetical protein